MRRGLVPGLLTLAFLVSFVGLALVALLSADTGMPSPSGAFGGRFDVTVWRSLRFTLLQAGLSTLLSVLLALPVAHALARRPHFLGRLWLVRLMALPLGLPALVAALGLLGIWGRQGVVNHALAALGLSEPISIYGLSGILIAHVFFNMPLAARLFLSGLERIPGEHWRIAANLGMGSLSLWRLVEWPVLRGLLPGVAGLIFMLCATSFTLVLTLGGGPAATTLEVAIYQALRFDFDPVRAMALSALQIGVTLGLLLALRLAAPAPEEATTLGRASRRFDGKSLAPRMIDVVILGLAAVFVAAPLAAVAASGLAARPLRLLSEPAFQQALATSLAIAAASALICVALSTCLVTARLSALSMRRRSLPARLIAGASDGAGSLVLLVPPVVLGAGWFLLLRGFGAIGHFAPIIVILINALMALPFATRILSPAIATHHARTGRLAESLGLAGWNRLRRIDLPCLARPLLMALSFAAALSLGDLGAVALFGSQDLVTLPYLLFSRLGSYRIQDADALALLLGLVCLALTMAGTPGRGHRAEREGRPI
ncbi:thiamine/thiamine pyrophosphate ABC transporter, permease protein [Xaviernesmea oryzae]|uniref:Thiamine transport system permease protein ThiP n=1 Tax=Xaviernesmea oryzae TaxID=464029 RepID=A0A1Q9AXL9_9HYPH|nr:thiamine/thiamine pyrophosphate ABC transporter permease [Xaviernesmea oryzae]OLP60179.1 thiamine/thiamine pyrophosphate ABC transporter, permease protein [Xaviernesmea oryzae]SEK30059.1 thiamine transport system permease protein [Xaviernesmea oryzae]